MDLKVYQTFFSFSLLFGIVFSIIEIFLFQVITITASIFLVLLFCSNIHYNLTLNAQIYTLYDLRDIEESENLGEVKEPVSSNTYVRGKEGERLRYTEILLLILIGLFILSCFF
jgi:hypothetical protein